MFDFLMDSLVLGIISIVVVIAIGIGAIASRYKIAKADEAYIITGRKGKPVTNPETGEVTTDLSGQKVVISGGVFVVPFIQQADKISLKSRKIMIRIDKVLSDNNVLLNVEAVAIIKVGGTEGAVRAAAQRFRGQQEAIEDFATETLTGSLRSIVGGMTVEDIIRDRAKLAAKVREEAESSLASQGLVVDTLQVQSVTDDHDYIRNLSRPEAARVEQIAKIAEAESRQVAAEREAKAQENIAEAQKALSIRQAQIQAETDKAVAIAAASGPLAEADQEQNVLTAQELVAARQAELTARQLESTVNKPAEAAKYRVAQEADAEKYRLVQEAEAKRSADIANAEAKAAAVKLAAAAELEERTARAKAIKLEGDAEAASILARGEAEAEALRKKAEAFKQYNDAAVTQMVVDMLPEVAGRIAEPLANIDGLTIISNDGASKLTQTTTDVLSQTLTVAKELTGIDFTDLISKSKANVIDAA